MVLKSACEVLLTPSLAVGIHVCQGDVCVRAICICPPLQHTAPPKAITDSAKIHRKRTSAWAASTTLKEVSHSEHTDSNNARKENIHCIMRPMGSH
eukprot:m.1558760 g.1558760  ORF g.1558760 m.1558760 type:complete len:96 (+) comp25273_c0_seq77:7389-7676(+)